jgi:hypothetical protein
MTLTPDSEGRMAGTSYPYDRAPQYSFPIGKRAPRLRELLSSLCMRAGVRLLKPHQGEVMIVRTDSPPHPGWIRDYNRHLQASGHGVVVFLPVDCRVHFEAERLVQEDRGFKSTSGEDKGVHLGVPE